MQPKYVHMIGRSFFTSAVRWSLAGLALTMVACSGGSEGSAGQEDALVKIGDSVITRSQILRELPPGLAPQDSAALFRSILLDRIDALLLTDIAAENSDELERIERMTDQYRRRLIIESYRRRIRESGQSDPGNDTLRAYYQRNADRFLLERPLMKGIFIKVPSGSRHLPDLRRWMQIRTADAIDNIEKYGLEDAVKYSFFEDRWVDFGIVEQQIPYRFYDADEFLEKTRFFETSYGGMTYLLSVGDCIHSGERMPYEAAVPLIRETIEARQGVALERRVIRELYDRAKKSGRLVVLDSAVVEFE